MENKLNKVNFWLIALVVYLVLVSFIVPINEIFYLFLLVLMMPYTLFADFEAFKAGALFLIFYLLVFAIIEGLSYSIRRGIRILNYVDDRLDEHERRMKF